MKTQAQKVLLVCYEYPPLGGGGSVFLKNLLNTINKIAPDLQIDVISYGNKNFEDESKVKISDKIYIHRVGRFLPRKDKNTTSFLNLVLFPIFALPKGFQLLSKTKYNKIYSIFVVPSGLVGFILSKVYNIPHYVTIIGGDIYKPTNWFSPHKNPLLRFVISIIINGSYKVNAISRDVTRKSSKFFKLSNHVQVYNLGVMIDSIYSFVKPDQHPKYKKFTFISIGRLDSRKGFDLLIKAFNKINQKNLQLLIIGDGPEREKLDSLIYKLNIEKKIKLLGFLPEKEKYEQLQKSHAFVLSSYHEGFGLVLVEAMAFGLTLISTRCGGPEDIIRDKNQGILVEVGNIKQLSEAMKLVVTDMDFTTESGNTNLQQIDDFNMTNVTKKYLTFLDLS